jgi:hypothetical protein
MSYEGYCQIIGVCGHYYENSDTYNYDEETPEKKCQYCGADRAFENAVDQTNNPSDGFIDFNKHFLLTAAVVDVCNLGHQHIVIYSTYRIPTKEEAEKFREYTCPNGTHNCKRLHFGCSDECDKIV